jgi:predicted DNA-binding transcriptional regulator YafY
MLTGCGDVRINRLFGIVHFLLVNGIATAGELAKRFEVSERTILRDVDTLSAAGIPVYTAQGKGGGIALTESYVLNKAAVSDDEQNEILFALQSLSATGQADVDRILVKLRALFDKANTDWIQVDFSGWRNSEPDNKRFETLKQAIIGQQAVRFVYASSYGETTLRHIYPLKLVFKLRAWYLQGFCLLKQDYRTFRIRRMSDLELLPETFADKTLNPPSALAGDMPSVALVRLKMIFSPHAVYRVYDEFDEDDMAKQGDGSMLVEVDWPEDDWLYGFLLSFGTSVRILEPRSVKERLIEKIDNLEKIYSRNEI